MGLFYNYNKAGTGISKDEPKKKGAGLFFDILGRKLWQIFALNFIYFLFFMPLTLIPLALAIPSTAVSIVVIVLLVAAFLILIGPATAGVTRVLRMFLIGKHCFIFRDFSKGFKSNFKNASIVGFLDCIIITSVYASFKVYPVLAHDIGAVMYVPMIIGLSVALVVLMMNFYIFLMMVATSLSLKNLLKNSFALAFVAVKANFLTILISLIPIVVMIVLFFLIPTITVMIFPFFPAAFILYIICFNCYPVIQKFIINPYYASIGQVNPELAGYNESEEETIFEDMGGKEQPVDVQSKKKKGKRIS